MSRSATHASPRHSVGEARARVKRGLLMKVRDLMTKTVASCHPETNLASAGALMWESDCGMLPVVDDRNKVVAVITDRDVCIALTTTDRRASAIKVDQVVKSRAFVCDPDDDVQAALSVMRRERVHRLPVVNRTGMLEGILSINDLILRADKGISRRRPEVSYDDVVDALKEICANRRGRRSAAGELRVPTADGVF
jgi:CBS domain-containing protein